MSDPLASISLLATPQTAPADPRQVVNSAKGFTFEVDPMTALRRFLTLGTTGGTYYVGESELTQETARAVIDLVRTVGLAVVGEVVEISSTGRAPKQNPALFTLAVAAAVGDDPTRQAAFAALPQVARTGTHLFLFAKYIEQFRGWGRGLRKAVGQWYSDKDTEALAYQMVKYRQRDGWSHRDLLRLSHPVVTDPSTRALFDWACGRGAGDDIPALVAAVETAHLPGVDLVELIRGRRGLSWEMLPSERLNDPAVWRALLEVGLPMTALLRQLPRLTKLGLCDAMTPSAEMIVEQLTDSAKLQRARVHPISVLVALRTYASGRSARGEGEWTPSPVIIDALDRAFYASFKSVEPSGKRTLLALDVSGSMTSPVAGLPISCREASAALALVTAAIEPKHQIVGFTAGLGAGLFGRRTEPLKKLSISPRQRLDDAIRAVSDLDFGGTDCSLPMRWALAKKKPVDTFVVLTDNETWAGTEHPHESLRRYRAQMGIDAKLVVVAMTATRFTIADPTDVGMLDVSGFDAATPNLISDFSAGLI